MSTRSAPLAKKTFLNSKIASVVREGGRVTVVHKNGDKEVFDHVVFGCASRYGAEAFRQAD